jgi:methylsterol monooxygenase
MKLEHLWSETVDRYPAGLIEVIGTVSVQLLVIFVYGIPYMVFVPSSRRAMRRCLPHVLSNTFYLFLFHIISLYAYGRSIGFPGSFWSVSFSDVSKRVPSLRELVTVLVVGDVLFDTMFYGVHRLLHTKWLMRNMHYFHHSFKEEVPWAAFYVHPVEYVFVLAVALASYIKTNVLALWFAIGVFVFIAQKIHTGHGLPLMMNHDGHHMMRGKNFGSIGLTDYLCGTLVLKKG